MKQKTYYQLFHIPKRCQGFRMLDEYEDCPLCHKKVQLCKIGMMLDFIYGYKRCSICFVKIPLPLKVMAFLKRYAKKRLEAGQMTL